MVGPFRTPAHGTRVPPSDSDSVAAQMAAAAAAEQQRADIAESISLKLVLDAIGEIKGDVKGHGVALNQVMVKMAEMDGDAKVMSQGIGNLDTSVRELGAKMSIYERGTSTASATAIRGVRAEQRGDGSGWISTAGLVKLIGAIFTGISLLAGAYLTGHSHGASGKEQPTPPSTTRTMTPP